MDLAASDGDDAPFRVAFRVEGDEWVAYLAARLTMEGARKLGSINMALVRDSKARKQAFVEMMKDATAELVAVFGGAAVIGWGEPARAPEHERAGRA